MNKIILLTTLLLCLVSTAQAEPVVSISPAKSTVNVGEDFSVDIVMADFPPTEGGGVTLRFKSSIV